MSLINDNHSLKSNSNCNCNNNCNIGNYYIEELIKIQYENELSIIEEESLKLKDKYLKQKYLNEILKKKEK